jgi:asparagine synthetase A
VKCFNCGGAHYANECTKPKKEKDKSAKLNYQSEDSSSDYQSATTEQCSCYGKCNCEINVLTPEYEKSIELLSQGIAATNDPTIKALYMQMLQEQVKAASKTVTQEPVLPKGKIIPGSIPFTSVEELIAQFKPLASPKLTLESLNSEIKTMKRQIEHLYSLNSPRPQSPQIPSSSQNPF